ncbi:hypothetical protein DXG01_001339 [Tephrocybe rancida]|nr:hypothetical protein DXG01_001339 [Tephrocybe rancida]
MDKVLPNEVDELIIDQLKDDPKSLSQCSLVSSHWLNRSRYWLFHDFKLYIWVNSLHKLVKLFSLDTSNLTPHIRSLHLSGAGEWNYDPSPDRKRVKDKKYEELNRLLPTMLPRLNNVQTLGVSSFSWGYLEPHNQASILRMPLKSLSWEAVDFDRSSETVSEPSSIVDSLQIQRLEFGRARTNNIEFNTGMLPRRQFSCLQSLQLIVDDTSASIISMIDPGNIHTLCLTVHEKRNLRLIDKLIRAAGSSLTSLELRLWSLRLHQKGMHMLNPLTASSYAGLLTLRSYTDIFPLSLSANPNLECLNTDIINSNDMSWVSRLAHTIRSTRPVKILMTLGSGVEAGGSFEDFDLIQFQTGIIQRHGTNCPSVHVAFWPRLAVPNWADDVERSLKDLACRGKLFIDTDPGPAFLC